MQSDLHMKEFVVNLLKNNLPPTYYYHDVDHSLYVMEKTIEIAKNEHCSAEEIRLLSTAALWHDVGFVNIYVGHEEESCSFAKQYLPGYGYSEAEIKIICGMIMATKMPQSPKNRLEEILADADLEYLGTNKPEIIADNLFLELRSLHHELTEEQWNHQQITFLKKHHYFTNYCKENMEPVKSAYLKKLQDKVK